LACCTFTFTGKDLSKSKPNQAERRIAQQVLAAGAAPLFLEQRYVPDLPIDSITEHPANPNEGDIGALHEMIDTNDFYGAVLVQEKTPDGEMRMRIVAGNHRHRTLKQKGKHIVPAFLCVMDDERALRILLGDNKSRDRASTNEDTLARTLQALNAHTGNLSGTGFDTDDLQDILKRLSTREKETKSTENGQPPSPYTKAEKSEALSWPVIQIRVPPALLAEFTDQMTLESGKPWERLAKILERAPYSDNG
jgi:ParB-like nuclease domain